MVHRLIGSAYFSPVIREYLVERLSEFICVRDIEIAQVSGSIGGTVILNSYPYVGMSYRDSVTRNSILALFITHNLVDRLSG